MGIRARHHRVKTARDREMSSLMRQIKVSNPGLPQHQILSTASKQLSGRTFGSGVHINPYTCGTGVHIKPYPGMGRHKRIYY